MKSKHSSSTKGLHSIGKEPLPSNSGSKDEGNAGADYNSGEEVKGEHNPDMSHIEMMCDDMSDEEAKHAHKHLSKKMEKKEEGHIAGTDINDFASKDGEQS